MCGVIRLFQIQLNWTERGVNSSDTSYTFYVCKSKHTSLYFRLQIVFKVEEKELESAFDTSLTLFIYFIYLVFFFLLNDKLPIDKYNTSST